MVVARYLHIDGFNVLQTGIVAWLHLGTELQIFVLRDRYNRMPSLDKGSVADMNLLHITADGGTHHSTTLGVITLQVIVGSLGALIRRTGLLQVGLRHNLVLSQLPLALVGSLGGIVLCRDLLKPDTDIIVHHSAAFNLKERLSCLDGSAFHQIVVGKLHNARSSSRRLALIALRGHNLSGRLDNLPKATGFYFLQRQTHFLGLTFGELYHIDTMMVVMMMLMLVVMFMLMLMFMLVLMIMDVFVLMVMVGVMARWHKAYC